MNIRSWILGRSVSPGSLADCLIKLGLVIVFGDDELFIYVPKLHLTLIVTWDQSHSIIRPSDFVDCSLIRVFFPVSKWFEVFVHVPKIYWTFSIARCKNGWMSWRPLNVINLRFNILQPQRRLTIPDPDSPVCSSWDNNISCVNIVWMNVDWKNSTSVSFKSLLNMLCLLYTSPSPRD